MMTKPRVIDWHAHFLPLKLIEAYRQTPHARSTSWLWEASAFSDPEEHIRMMDDVGVDIALLGPPNSFMDSIKAAGMDVEQGVKFANDELAKAVQKYPDRLHGAVGLDPFNIRFSLAEMERGVTKLGLKAISMVTSYGGLYIDNKQFWPIFKMAEELDVPIFAHPANATLYWKEAQKADKNYLRSEISMLLDSTICVGRFVIFGVYDRFPRLKVVFGQLGGFIPFIFGRFDVVYNFYQHWPSEVVKDEAVFPLRLARDYKGRIMGDTHSVDCKALECAVETLGADCIVLGSDYPITPDSFGIRWSLNEIAKMRVSEDDRNKMLGENTARLLKLGA